MVMTSDPWWQKKSVETSEKEKGVALKRWIQWSPVPLLVVGVLSALQPPDCSTGSCPGYAFTSPWIFRAERGLFAALLLLVLLTVVVRLIVEGEFPDQIGREGFGWK